MLLEKCGTEADFIIFRACKYSHIGYRICHTGCNTWSSQLHVSVCLGRWSDASHRSDDPRFSATRAGSVVQVSDRLVGFAQCSRLESHRYIHVNSKALSKFLYDIFAWLKQVHKPTLTSNHYKTCLVSQSYCLQSSLPTV